MKLYVDEFNQYYEFSARKLPDKIIVYRIYGQMKIQYYNLDGTPMNRNEFKITPEQVLSLVN